MNIPLQATPITGFAELAPQKRSIFFFTPIRNAQGQLIDLQLFQSDQLTVGANISVSYLSDWVSPQSATCMTALWSALEKGVSCSLDYQQSTQTAGQLIVTPLQNGYLVEIQPKNASSLSHPVPDPLLALMRVQIQKEHHRQVMDSLLQSIGERVPCQQAISYIVDPTNPNASVQSQLVEGQGHWPTCIPGVIMDALRTGEPVVDQQIEAHTAGLAVAFALYQAGYRSFMLVPLLAKKQLLGALLVVDEKAHFFTASYQKIILELAHALGKHQLPILDQPPSAQLDATSQLLEAIVFNTPVGLALFRPVWQAGQIIDFTYLLTNPANATLTGRRIAQMAAQTLKTLFPQTTQVSLFDRLVSVAQTGVSEQYQEHAQHDGLSFWGQFTLCRVGENVLFMVVDTTPLQQTQALLRKKNGQLRKRILARTQQIRELSALQQAIVNHAGQAIIAADLNGVIQTMNQAGERLLGFAPNEGVGLVARMRPGSAEHPTPVISCHPPETDTVSVPFLQKALAGQNHLHLECGVLSKDDQLIPVLLTISCLQDENQKTIGYVGVATDVSALKKAEAKLRQKNRELSTFFEGALDMHCISDSQGVISKVNGAFQQALGYSASELMAIRFLELIHPDEQKDVYQHLLMTILEQPVRNQINQFRCQDGSYRMIEWNAIGIDELVYGSARDITQRQENEIQVRNLNQRLQLATQSIGQGIWEQDLQLGTLIWEDRLLETIGIEPGRADWSFEQFIKLIHPQDRASFLESTQRVTQPGSQDDRFSSVFRIIKPNGTIIYLESHGLVVKNAAGQPIQAIGVAWDVTERKLAEAALRESEQRFKEIAENVDEVFWIHSVEPFELLYINSAYERVFGISGQEEPGDDYSFLNTIIDEDRDRVKAEFENYCGGQEVRVECRVQGTHSTIRWLQIKTFVMRDCQGIPVRYIGIVNDITSQKETEFVLHQSLAREQELNQLKSQFVSTASHEFRTPLTTIQTSVDLIKLYQDMPGASARKPVQHHLGVIQDQIERVTKLLSDLLTIGTIEAGKIAFVPQWVDMVVLGETLIRTHFSERGDGRTVEVLIEGIPRQMYIDEKLMGHVFVNLLSNAFKFSTGVSPRLQMIFGKERLLIQVIDAGIGIPTGEQSTLFQAFCRASNTAGIQGTGLGLVITRQFVERHDGWIEVESEEKKGTTFTITLPYGCHDQV